jgi:glycosyltransferase involved in cell wall biosynthesis
MPLPEGRLLAVVAHPDDETVGAGILLSCHPDAWILHLTDGAPRDRRFIARGFTGTREEYAAVRRRELEAAMALIGIGPDRLLRLDGVADQEAALALSRLAAEIAALCRELRPAALLTLAYEGGHPDHDAAAQAVRRAADRLREDGDAAPEIFEMPLYHASAAGPDGPTGMTVQEFLPHPEAASSEEHVLTPEEQKLKERMIACFATQAETLAAFLPPVREVLRRAPRYDFNRRPHAGRLQWEVWGMVRPPALTILLVAYPFAPVGPDAVGGAEQVLAALDAALVEAGHRSIVVACAGSVCRGTLVATPRWERLDESVYAPAHAAHQRAVASALERWPVDVVHLHGLDFASYLPPPGPAALATLHLRPDLYPRDALFPERPRTWLCCVSAAQHRTCPPGMPLLDPVPNGVDPDDFRPRGAKEGFALCLGRICPEKGFHLAVDAAKEADVPLLIGGDVFPYPAHQRYFAAELKPRLDGRRQLVGPVGGEEKRRLLAAARCLLVPSLVAETSSLVALEALASGTPVIAFPSGALAEIVEPGRTGFLVSDVREMAAALRAVAALDPADCRRAAEERFPASRRTARYLDLYQWLAAR